MREENESGAGLPEKVKGSHQEGGASFKPFSNPDGVGDEASADPNGSGVKMPQDGAKTLPKAGKIS